MATGPADDVVYLALTVGLAAALALTLRLRERAAAPRPGPAAHRGLRHGERMPTPQAGRRDGTSWPRSAP
jgi:hypothetical protein